MLDSTITFGGQSLDVLSNDLDYEPLPASYVQLLLACAKDTYAECTYHRKRLQRAGLEPGELQGLEDFWRIPPMTSRDVDSTPPTQLLPDATREALRSPRPTSLQGPDRIVRVSQSTTSSGGNAKLSYYTKADWDASCSLSARLHRCLPEADCSRVFNCFHPGHGAGRYFVEALGHGGALVLNRHHAATSIEEIVDQMTRGFADLGGFNCVAAPPYSPNPQAKGVTGARARVLEALRGAGGAGEAGERVEVVVGDLGRPRLGLGDERFDALADRVDTIHHVGAQVDFLGSYARARASNVEGTLEILRLCTRGRPSVLHHTSSVAVFASEAHGGTEVDEHSTPALGRFGSAPGYCQGKWVAERLVDAARERGLTASIYRVGALGPHEQTGRFNPRDFMTTFVLGCIELGLAPRIDVGFGLAPVDRVAGAMVALSVDEGALSGTITWWPRDRRGLRWSRPSSRPGSRSRGWTIARGSPPWMRPRTTCCIQSPESSPRRPSPRARLVASSSPCLRSVG